MQLPNTFMPGFIVQNCQISNNNGIATTNIQVASMLCNIYIYIELLCHLKRKLYSLTTWAVNCQPGPKSK